MEETLFKTRVTVPDLDIECAAVGEMIEVRTTGNLIRFPKDRTQDVIDALLVIDWAIMRRRGSQRYHAQRAEADKGGCALKEQ